MSKSALMREFAEANGLPIVEIPLTGEHFRVLRVDATMLIKQAQRRAAQESLISHEVE